MPNPNTATQTGLETPNAQTSVKISRSQLPLHCPMPGSSLWNSHPRVFIPLGETGHEVCPYCGTVYELAD